MSVVLFIIFIVFIVFIFIFTVGPYFVTSVIPQIIYTIHTFDPDNVINNSNEFDKLCTIDQDILAEIYNTLYFDPNDKAIILYNKIIDKNYSDCDVFNLINSFDPDTRKKLKLNDIICQSISCL